ncbi:MAG: hypothetical protein AAF378_13505 [Cyanobacteria bacterium P01_A01_bin.84]
MKNQIILSFLVLGTSLFSYIPSVHGEPADIFKPVLGDLQKQLPPGLTMRLPSYIPPSEDTPMYPFVESDDKGVRVNIGIRPDCSSSKKPQLCIIGAIAALKPGSVKSFPPKGDNLTEVNLDNGVRGFFFTRGQGEAQVSYIIWEQDKQKFAIAAFSQITSQEELTRIAKSATTEKPITSASQ